MILLHAHTHTGTHDISNAEVTETETGLEMTTSYFDSSSGTGALYCLIFTQEGTVDFTRYICLALSSRNYTLPYERLHPGDYKVLVYDIEPDGTLRGNISYPACTKNITSNGGQRVRGTVSSPLI